MKNKTLTNQQLTDFCGTLSKPSKMPCFSTSISAALCNVGGKLAGVKGSVCAGCYALRGNYQFSAVKEAMEKRVKNIEHKNWPHYMAELISRSESSGYFRWHDSGDIKSVKHLANICKVAELTPKIKHWIPSREYNVISKYTKKNKIPKNLTIRLSAFMVDGPLPTELAKRLGVRTSGVTSDKSKANCKSWGQGGKCLSCRACWDSKKNINYLKH